MSIKVNDDAHKEREEYIGDGVYASFDGFNIVLRVERNGKDETIYLEPVVFEALLIFAKKFYHIR